MFVYRRGGSNMKFVSEEFKNFKLDLKEALKELEEKYSINVEVRGIHYSDVTFDCDLHIKKTDIDADRFEWDQVCELYGLKKEHYNAIIEIERTYFLHSRTLTYTHESPIFMGFFCCLLECVCVKRWF